MTSEELVGRIFELTSFQKLFNELLRRSVVGEFPGLVPQDELEAPLDLKYLLTCASLLAQSKDGVHQDTALRIAQFGLQTSDSEILRSGSAAVLDALTNNPALILAFKRKLVSKTFLDEIPGPLRLDSLMRSFETSVLVKGALFRFTRFQSAVFKGALSAEWMSISAPTSAGKSYILARLVGHYLDTDATRIAFIVPTRALIQQVMVDLTELNAQEGRADVLVTTMPQVPKELGSKKCIFVLTQERMHWLLSQTEADFQIDVLIVDEAQKISDGSRGILLQQVIEQAARRFGAMRILFSAPMTSNPELLLEDKPDGKSATHLTSTQPTVNQNLIWAEQESGKPANWQIHHCRGENLELLGAVKLPASPTLDSKRLPFLAYAMTESGSNGGCLIYVNGQADAEKTAFILGQLRQADAVEDDEISDLKKLVIKTIHKDYLLTKVLTKGVAFHYGNMPLLIRSEIERLFKSGKIRYLVCTATLIEGVNLPAKYIFVRGPRKGKTPLSESDFWNLAGRAGRLGSEFQGSVVCVDPRREEVWKQAPPRSKGSYQMKRALDGVLNEASKFLEYLAKEKVDKKPQDNPAAEHTLVYCAELLEREGTLAMHPWAKRLSLDDVKKIEEAVRSALDGIQIEPALIRKNPGVSPVAQQRLLKYFREYDKPLEQLLPFPPEDPDAVKGSYVKVVGRISSYLSGEHAGLTFPRAILVVNWMRGYSLKRMIESNLEYWTTRGKSVPCVIRKTMEEVEQYARFRFVKYASCYIDVLSQHLREINRAELIATIPQIQVYAEFGASQPTQMSLMDLGLSRVSAIALSELIVKTDMTRDECIRWIIDTDLTGLSISPIVIKEIDTLKSGFAVKDQSGVSE